MIRSKRKTGAIAIFVKTPGLSPVKTRLAEAIGREAAERFYTLSVEATRGVIEQALQGNSLLELHLIKPYWAIAETGGPVHPLWDGFDRIYQGRGGLGERLAHVYSELIQKHDFVLLIGADSPHLSPSLIRKAVIQLCAHDGRHFILGPSEDGGFYLFGGKTRVPSEVWTNVPYSQSSTAEALRRAIQDYGSLSEIDSFFDIDTISDLERLASITEASPLLPEQKRVIAFAQTLVRHREVVP